MSFQNVEDWLRALGLLQYAQAFYDNGYDNLDICKQITQDDLNVIGVKNEKDRTDIEIGVHQLGRDVLYFELVPEDGQPAASEVSIERKKFDEVKLKSIIKEELEGRNVQLTEPPYFYPDGTFGDLFGLAVSISLKLETYAEDVFEALEQMQKRQLPSGVFEEEEETLPQEYLNVENPQGPTRSFSMSRYDKRVTKSTTDLHAATTDGSSSELSSKFNKKRHMKGGNKQAFGQKILQSFRKKSAPSNGKEAKEVQRSVSAFNASDVRLTQDEILSLLGKVKKQEMSQDEVLGTINRHLMSGTTTPTGKENLSSANSSPEVLRKKTKKQKKSKGDELRRDKRSGSATFYTMGEEGTFKSLLSEKLSDDSTISEDNRSISDAIPEECEVRAATLPGDSPASVKQTNILDKVRNSLRRGHKATDESKDSSQDPQSGSSTNSSPGTIRIGEKVDSSGCTSIQIKVPNTNKNALNGQVKQGGNVQPARSAPPPPMAKLKSLSFCEEPEDNKVPMKKHSLGSNVANRIQVLPPLFPPSPKKENSLPQNHVARPAPPPRKDQRSTSDPITPTAPKSVSDFFYEGNKSVSPAEEKSPIKSKEHPKAPPRRKMSKDLTDGSTTTATQEIDTPKSSITPPSTFGSDRVKPRVRPTLPPRPPKTDKAISAAKQLTLLEQAQLDNKTEEDTRTPEFKKKILKTKPLKSLVATKLRRESINISDEPYTLPDGKWHIPLKMVERYSEELNKSQDDIIQSLEDVRMELRSRKGEIFMPVESGNFVGQKTIDGTWSVRDCLFEIGLPMFSNDLCEAGIDNIKDLIELEEDDLKDVGVFENRHIERLLSELKKIQLE